MRKFLWMVAVGALVLAVAAPAMALDFKFGSEYRIRFYDGAAIGFGAQQGLGNGGNPTENQRGVQIRVRPRFDVSDDNGNITATLRLEIGDIEWGNGGGASGVTAGGGVTAAVSGANGTATSANVTPGSARVGNGAGGSLGNDGVNVETKWAYVDFSMPFGVPARVRAGLQPWFTPKGIVVDDDTVGVRIYGTVKPVSYELSWYRASGGPLTAAVPAGAAGQSATNNALDNNYDYYGGRVDVAVSKWLNPGVYYIYGENKTQCTSSPITGATGGCTDINRAHRTRNNHFIGFTDTGQFGTVSYDLDWIYGISEGGPAGNFPSATFPTTVRGWALDGSVHFPVGPVTVNLAGAYGSGDKQNGGDSEAFPYISPSWNGAGGGFEMIGSGGPFDAVEYTQDAPTNLWMIGGWVEYRPVKALWLKAAYAYAGFATKNGNCGLNLSGSTPTGSTGCFGPAYKGNPTTPLAGRSGLGHELSFRADYDVWTGFKVQTQIGWILPTKGDVAGEYILQLYYNF